MNNYTIDRFSVLVIGVEPKSQIEKYDDLSYCETPYILYKYSDRKKIRMDRIKFYNEFLKSTTNRKDCEFLKAKIKEIESMTDHEFYISLGETRQFDLDKR